MEVDEDTTLGSDGPVSLTAIFRQLVEQKNDVKITLDSLNELLSNDLKLGLDHLSNSHLIALPYMLINYIKKWPGWDKRSEYQSGSLDYESWYKRFHSYILFKMSLLISKTLTAVETDMKNEAKIKTHATNSTQLSNRASFANFTIEIAGPPTLLSNLVFWGNADNVIAEKHSDKPWILLDYVQLLNYPYVEVEFNSPELSFKRAFEPRMSRYISGCIDLHYEKPNFILGKHRINPTTSKFIFPTSLLKDYIKLYKETVSSQIPIYQREEVNVILDQFYKDMIDINSDNCVAENRQVTFNIGRNMFKRSKKIPNDKDNPSAPNVIYNEVFLPKITSSFRYFTGMQEYTADGKRVTTSAKENSSVTMLKFKPLISYKCVYCKLAFLEPHSRAKMATHLEISHKREQSLLCLKCKKICDVIDLAKNRWKCECQEK